MFRGKASSVIATNYITLTAVLKLSLLAKQMNGTLRLFLLNTHHSQ